MISYIYIYISLLYVYWYPIIYRHACTSVSSLELTLAPSPWRLPIPSRRVHTQARRAVRPAVDGTEAGSRRCLACVCVLDPSRPSPYVASPSRGCSPGQNPNRVTREAISATMILLLRWDDVYIYIKMYICYCLIRIYICAAKGVITSFDPRASRSCSRAEQHPVHLELPVLSVPPAALNVRVWGAAESVSTHVYYLSTRLLWRLFEILVRWWYFNRTTTCHHSPSLDRIFSRSWTPRTRLN